MLFKIILFLSHGCFAKGKKKKKGRKEGRQEGKGKKRKKTTNTIAKETLSGFGREQGVEGKEERKERL